MAQANNSDYFLDNQTGKDFRDELNEILADIKSNNSSSGPPSSSGTHPHVEGQMYYDTDNNGELMVCTSGGNPGTFKKVDTNTTYSAGSGVGLSGTTFSVAGGTGLTQTTTGLNLDTASSTEIGGVKVRFDSGTSTLFIRNDGTDA